MNAQQIAIGHDHGCYTEIYLAKRRDRPYNRAS